MSARFGSRSTNRYTREEMTLQAAEIFELRLQKMSFREIALKVGLSPATCIKRMETHRKLIVFPGVEDMRKDLSEEYDRLSQKLEQDLDSPDPRVRAKAIEVKLKVMRGLREMHGVDIPVKTEVSITSTLALDSNIAGLLSRIQQKEISNVVEGEIIDGMDDGLAGSVADVLGGVSGDDGEEHGEV